MAVNLPYLMPQKDRRGKVAYYYYRRGGRLVGRIEDENGRPLLPGQAGFLTAYDAMHARASDSPLPKESRIQQNRSATMADPSIRIFVPDAGGSVCIIDDELDRNCGPFSPLLVG